MHLYTRNDTAYSLNDHRYKILYFIKNILRKLVEKLCSPMFYKGLYLVTRSSYFQIT